MPSSVIAAMNYDAAARVLTIVFRGEQGTYRYFDVPATVWAAFQAAPSKGTYLNEVFKEMGFGYEKLERVEEPPCAADGVVRGRLLRWPKLPG